MLHAPAGCAGSRTSREAKSNTCVNQRKGSITTVNMANFNRRGRSQEILNSPNTFSVHCVPFVFLLQCGVDVVCLLGLLGHAEIAKGPLEKLREGVVEQQPYDDEVETRRELRPFVGLEHGWELMKEHVRHGSDQ